MVKKALSQHKRLHRLFAETDALSKLLSLVEEEPEQQIRFEERVLFKEIKKFATDEKFNDNTDDPFWD